MSDGDCPYKALDERSFWRSGVREPMGRVSARGQWSLEDSLIGPVGSPIRISPDTAIGSAGSCFAAYISKYLKSSGYNYVDLEAPKFPLPKDLWARFGFGLFSARYGNIYTAKQFAQLVREGLSRPRVSESLVLQSGSQYFDILRPYINGPSGFASATEAMLDRRSHLQAVHQVIKASDVFVFTLGLTEAWVCRESGRALPVCPGCGYGQYSDRFEFKNFSFSEVVSDLNDAIRVWRKVNSKTHFILTVSPVPLTATFSGQDVVTATSRSKAILLAAAQELASSVERCTYFPSFELVMSPLNSRPAFQDNMREVCPETVGRVMDMFGRFFLDTPRDTVPAEPPDHSVHFNPVTDDICDEERSYSVRPLD